jgi:hypothetical protein
MAMATAIPVFPPLEPDDEPSSLPQKWEEWIAGLGLMILAMSVDDHKRQWPLLQHYGGAEIRVVEKQLEYDKAEKYGLDTKTPSKDHCKLLKDAFTAHFAPSANFTYASNFFHSMTQEEGKSICHASARTS